MCAHDAAMTPRVHRKSCAAFVVHIAEHAHGSACPPRIRPHAGVADRPRALAAPRRRARGGVALGRTYEGAAEFLAAHASLPITIEDAADAAGATVPELVDAFRAHTPQEFTPTAFLRDFRIRAAMADLRTGDPTLGDTVKDIAHRWGFASPSRFAAHFRAAYGVSPKWVLDR